MEPTTPSPLRQPHIPISESEMIGSDPINNNQQDSSSGSKNTLLTLAAFLVLAGIVGITLYLYIQNKTAGQKIVYNNIDKNAKKEVDNTKNYIPKTTEEKKMAADLQKYGVVCKKFTSLEEALKTPDIACDLDLSNQNLTVIPTEILKLTFLNSINLSNNKLTIFPSQLLELPHLITINLSDNNIPSVPKEITHLKELQSINIKDTLINDSEVKNYYTTVKRPIQIISK